RSFIVYIDSGSICNVVLSSLYDDCRVIVLRQLPDRDGSLLIRGRPRPLRKYLELSRVRCEQDPFSLANVRFESYGVQRLGIRHDGTIGGLSTWNKSLVGNCGPEDTASQNQHIY